MPQRSKTLKKLVFLMCLVMVSCQDVVITAQGSLRGVPEDGYTSFIGIPYASLGEDAGRFKLAGLAPFWLGIREAATSTCSATSQVDECLRLDVHVPISGSPPWPVLVWVRGNGGQYHPRKLVQQGVIVVIVSHRMGPVGFLCLNEEEVPGNAGAKDVLLALRWVRDNIVAFRGNPAKVIVAGQGFGAAIVEAVMLSSTSQGLFQGVILQSGSVLSPWSFNYDAKERASTLGVLVSDDDDLPSILSNASIVDLVVQSEKINKPYFPFAICVEKTIKREQSLLTEAPYDLLSKRKVNSVPMIIGYNSDEAYVFVSNLKEARVLRRIKEDVSFLLPVELKFLNEREREVVARQIWDMYFKSNVTMASVLAFHRDAYFMNHIVRSARLHATSSHQPIYFYQFSYPGTVGVQEEPGVQKSGAAHSDELAYLFAGRDLDGTDGAVQLKLVKLWTNFAKYLTPTPKVGDSSSWDPTEGHDPRLLDIGADLKMERFPHKRATQLWDEIYDKYYYSRYRS